MAYTTIDDPSVYFQTALYTGNSGSNAITNDGNSDLQPDWVWLKERSSTSSHHSFDSTRGVGDNGKALIQNSSGAEGDDTAFRSFDSDGFTLASTNGYNQNTITNVAWQWKANGGSRTTFTESGNNPAGGYQANTTAGFSIVDYVGTGGAGTVSHGLGKAPDWIIIKARDGSDNNEHWRVGHVSLGFTHRLQLNETNAASDSDTCFNDTAPTSSVFTIGTDNKINTNDENMIAYCFAPIQGYSKFGSFTGNNSTDGPFVYTGFKPAFVIAKISSAVSDWIIIDNKRSPINLAEQRLRPNKTNVEDGAVDFADFLSNGFKIRHSGDFNADGVTTIYAAFAEHPFVSSEGVPVTAR